MIQTPNVQVQQDFSWLGDVGRVVGGLIEKYPEMKALDQAAKDDKQGKVNTYRELRQGLEKVTQDEEVIGAIANNPMFGGDKVKASEYLLSYADKFVPNESEGSGDYHKRVVETMSDLVKSNLFSNGDVKDRFATTMTTGMIDKEAKAHITEQKKRDQIKAMGQGTYTTSAEFKKAMNDTDLFDHAPTVKTLEEMETSEKQKTAYDAVQETVRKLYANELLDADGKPIIAKNLPVHEFARIVHANIGPDAKDQAGDIINGYIKDKELEMRGKEIDLDRVKAYMDNKNKGSKIDSELPFEIWKQVNTNLDKQVEDFNTQLTNLTSVITSSSTSPDEKARAKEQYKTTTAKKNALIKYKNVVGKSEYAYDLAGLMKVTEENKNLVEDSGVAYLRSTAKGFFENSDYEGFKKFADDNGLRKEKTNKPKQPYYYFDVSNNLIAIEDDKGIIRMFKSGTGISDSEQESKDYSSAWEK